MYLTLFMLSVAFALSLYGFLLTEEMKQSKTPVSVASAAVRKEYESVADATGNARLVRFNISDKVEVTDITVTDVGKMTTENMITNQINGLIYTPRQPGITSLGEQSQQLILNGKRIINVSDPIDIKDAVTKQFVTSVANNVRSFEPVENDTTNLRSYTASGVKSNKTLTGNVNSVFPTYNGYTMMLNDSILVNMSTNQIDNGVYSIISLGSGSSPWVLRRREKLNGNPVLLYTGSYIVSINGSAPGGGYVLTGQSASSTDFTVDVDVVPQTWVLFNISVSPTIYQTSITIPWERFDNVTFESFNNIALPFYKLGTGVQGDTSGVYEFYTEAGTYSLGAIFYADSVAAPSTSDYGIVSIYIDGSLETTVDPVSVDFNYNRISNSLLAYQKVFTKGQHQIYFSCTSKNALSTGYNVRPANYGFHISSITLT